MRSREASSPSPYSTSSKHDGGQRVGHALSHSTGTQSAGSPDAFGRIRILMPLSACPLAQDVSVGVNVFGIHPITVPNRRNCPPIGIVAPRCHNFHPITLSPKRLFRTASDCCKPWQFQFFRADAVPTKNRLVKSDIEPEFTNIRASFAIFRNETSRSQSAGRVMCRLPAFPADMGSGNVSSSRISGRHGYSPRFWAARAFPLRPQSPPPQARHILFVYSQALTPLFSVRKITMRNAITVRNGMPGHSA